MSGAPREALTDAAGRTVATFVRTTRDQLDAADLVEPVDGVALDDLADVALATFPGWAFSAPPDLGQLLLRRGATTIRHSHWLARDLTTDPPEPAWATLEPGNGLVVAPATLAAEDYLEATQAAYPPGHPDHEPAATAEERIAKDITPLLDGTYGRLLEESAVVETVARAGAAPQVVAACILVDRPESGPWVMDVFRRPEPSYAGLGTLLLKRCMAGLSESGYGSVNLAVTDSNTRARVTYERLDFRLVLESLTVRVPAAD